MSEKLKKLTSGKNNFALPDTVQGSTPPAPIPIPYPNIGQAGQPAALPPTVKHQLETKFGADLKDVRVYENHAPTLIGAKAFTSGSDIFMVPGSFNVSSEGQQLLGHEAAHVVQQMSGSVNEAAQQVIDDNSSSDAND